MDAIGYLSKKAAADEKFLQRNRSRHIQTFTDLLMIAGLSACDERKEERIIQYPTEQYEYAMPDTAKTKVHTTVYVPIYSHSYMVNGKRPTDFAATLSLRSTDFRDSIFFPTLTTTIQKVI